ncbi:hypothetical protein E1B28_006886 [Marasmius oreades]|uniref:BTB domain-containing protein n=1 Tax=Marasmius oreades TaxID=181124 RepID=A0A9P7UUC7_9AGAR|nr:uncharacterized protein E1B28_006886 [Marasmius oreades]KAG7093196.1 hypothetical protein E1B28_006886 [Marasmius oreades]
MPSEYTLPSPCDSRLHSPFNHGEIALSVSKTFGRTGGRIPIDIILISSDYVLFYTHEATLLAASNNSFRNLLPLPNQGDPLDKVAFVPEIPSPELEIMLYSIHNVPKEDFLVHLDIEAVMKAVDGLSEYGIPPSECITPSSHLYQDLLSCAPLYPFEVYALAAQYGMVSLAATASTHTLVLDLAQLSESLLQRMGAVYLLLLYQLHMERTKTLMKLLGGELGIHNPTPRCGFVGQRRLRRKWSMAVVSLVFLIKPNTTISLIREKIWEHTSDVMCPDCIRLRDYQLDKVVSEWSMTSRTINLR